jgi:ribose 5-phosphate isomerase A
LPFAYPAVVRKIQESLKGVCKLRAAVNKAGPIITDNGNFVIDCNFGKMSDPNSISVFLNSIPGIIEHGLFCGMASVAFFGQKDGTVSKITKTIIEKL